MATEGESPDTAAEKAMASAIFHEVESNYMKLREDFAKVEGERDELLQARRDLQAQLAHQPQILEMQSQMKSLEVEKKAAEERADRQFQEADRLRQEISRLTEDKKQLTAELQSSHVEGEVSRASTLPLEQEKGRLETKLSHAEAHTEWLTQELNAQTTKNQKLIQEHRDSTLQSQVQLEQLLMEKEALEVRHTELGRMEEQLQVKVKELSKDLLEARQMSADAQETHELEMNEQKRLVQTQEAHIQRLKERYSDIERECQALKSGAQEAMVASEKELADTRQQLEEKFEKLLQDQAAEYQVKLQKQSSTTPLTLPAAALSDEEDEEQLDEPLTLTDLYTKLQTTKKQLRDTTKRAQRAELENSKIQSELAHRLPEFHRQAEHYSSAMEQLSSFQVRLEEVLRDQRHADEDAKEARRETQRAQEAVEAAEESAKDLAKHVQVLLTAQTTGNANATVDDIPTNIQALQEHNSQLQRERRGWQTRIANLEQQVAKDELRIELKRSKEEIKTLVDERERQQVSVARIVQQRDLYKGLVQTSGNFDEDALSLGEHHQQRAAKLGAELEASKSQLAAITNELEAAQRQADTADERVLRYQAQANEFQSAINSLERDVVQARADSGRAQAQFKFVEDQLARSTQALERARQQAESVNTTRTELQRVNTDLQQALSTAQSRTQMAETKAQQAESQLRLIKASAKAAENDHERLMKEVDELRRERNQSSQLQDSIRRLEQNLEAQHVAHVSQLQSQIEQLRSSSAAAESRSMTQIESLQTKCDEIEAKASSAVSAKEEAEKEKAVLQSELAALTKKTADLKSELAVTKSQLLSARKKLGDNVDDPEEVALQDRVQALSKELEEAKAELFSVKKESLTYQSLAKDAEKALGELKQATDAVQASRDEQKKEEDTKMSELQKQADSSQQVVADLTKDLLTVQEERNELERALRAEILALKTENDAKVKDTEAAQAQSSALTLDMESLKQEVSKVQDQYERELRVHSQARTSLRAAREEVQAAEAARTDSEAIASESRQKLVEQEAAWQTERAKLLEAAKSAEESQVQLRERNAEFQTQVQKLAELVEKRQAERTDQVTSDETVTELRKVIELVRSDNEYLQTQLATAKSAAERDNANLAVVRRQWKEARARIEELQQQGADAGRDDSDVASKLQEAEAQLALLRDSNKLLRETADKVQESWSATMKEHDELKKNTAPAEKIRRELETGMARLKAEKEGLQRELDAWKERVQNLVSKLNQVDPEEHRKVIKERDELKAENTSQSAWRKTTEQESRRLREICKQLKAKNVELSGKLEVQVKEVTKLNSEKTKLVENQIPQKELQEVKEKLLATEKVATAAKKELESANTRNEQFRAKMREMVATMRELRAAKKDLEQKLKELQVKNEDAPSLIKEATPAEKKTSPPSKTVPQPKIAPVAAAIEEKPLPAVPKGGFKFGPSPRTSANRKLEPAKAPALSIAAKPFKPQSTGKPLVAAPTKKVPVASSKPASGEGSTPSNSQLEAATSEQKLKEQLLEKKRKLLEGQKKKQLLEQKKRKLAEQIASGADTTISPGPSISKQSRETEPIAKATEQGPPTKKPKPTEQEPKTKALTTVTEEAQQAAGAQSKTAANSDAEPGSSETKSQPLFKEVSNPFGGAKGAPLSFGQQTLGSQPTTFGSGMKPAVFGKASGTATSPSYGSGAFLNMKPPGSSTSPPSFTFGSTGSITLPTPSQPAPAPSLGSFQSAFGSTTFGAPAPPPAPKPLFGTNPPSDEPEKDDEEKPTEEN